MQRRKWHDDLNRFTRKELIGADTSVKVDAIVKRGFPLTRDGQVDRWLDSIIQTLAVLAASEEVRKQWDQLGSVAIVLDQGQLQRYSTFKGAKKNLALKALRGLTTEDDREGYTLRTQIDPSLRVVVIRDMETEITNQEQNLNENRVVDAHIHEWS